MIHKKWKKHLFWNGVLLAKFCTGWVVVQLSRPKFARRRKSGIQAIIFYVFGGKFKVVRQNGDKSSNLRRFLDRKITKRWEIHTITHSTLLKKGFAGVFGRLKRNICMFLSGFEFQIIPRWPARVKRHLKFKRSCLTQEAAYLPVFVQICKTVQIILKFANLKATRLAAFERIKGIKHIYNRQFVGIELTCVNISFDVLNFIYKSSYLAFTRYKTALLAMV